MSLEKCIHVFTKVKLILITIINLEHAKSMEVDPIFDPSFLHAGTRVCALIPGLTIGVQRRKGWKLWSTIYSTATMTTGWESKQILKLIQILKGDGVKR